MFVFAEREDSSWRPEVSRRADWGCFQHLNPIIFGTLWLRVTGKWQPLPHTLTVADWKQLRGLSEKRQRPRQSGLPDNLEAESVHVGFRTFQGHSLLTQYSLCFKKVSRFLPRWGICCFSSGQYLVPMHAEHTLILIFVHMNYTTSTRRSMSSDCVCRERLWNS